MPKNEIIYNGELTATLWEKKNKLQAANRELGNEEFGEEFEGIQQTWRVNPADEADYDGSIGYKDA